MSVLFTNKFLAAIKVPGRIPDIFIEIDLPGPVTVRWGQSKLFPDIKPLLMDVSTLYNKIDTSKALATKGELSFEVATTDYIKGIIRDNRIMNIRVRKYEGFIAEGWTKADYIKTFDGLMYDWTAGDTTSSFKAKDERNKLESEAPVAEEDSTHFIDYTGFNPIDIMTNFIETQAGVLSANYNGARFTSERDRWFRTWIYPRVITKSQSIENSLEELQLETGGLIYYDGNKISFKAQAPNIPGTTNKEWTEESNLLSGSVSSESGYSDQFFNRVEIYFDYIESGNDVKEDDYESTKVVESTESQSNWLKTVTKIIKSKWIRSFSFDQPSNITGVTVYHCSIANGAGGGTLSFDFSESTFTWQANGDTVGETVTVESSGRYQVKSSDENKYIRIVVDITLTPGSDQSDTITLTDVPGSIYASAVATRFLNKYLDPVFTIKGQLDYRDINNEGVMYAPTDTVNISTNKVFSYGQEALVSEPCMLTSVKSDPNASTVSFEAMPTRLGRKPMFIAPSGFPVYASATEAQREYWFIGRASDNKVFDGTSYVDGYYII